MKNIMLALAILAVAATAHAQRNAFCDGFNLQKDSPAIDAGVIIPGLHCPVAGPGDGTCVEWAGKAPDIGACEFITAVPEIPGAPIGLTVKSE